MVQSLPWQKRGGALVFIFYEESRPKQRSQKMHAPGVSAKKEKISREKAFRFGLNSVAFETMKKVSALSRKGQRGALKGPVVSPLL